MWRSNSVKSIRDTEQEPNSPPTLGSPIAKAIERFTNETNKKFCCYKLVKSRFIKLFFIGF
ncbi:hypothetical protein ID0302_05450 [Helicobacter pylori]